MVLSSVLHEASIRIHQGGKRIDTMVKIFSLLSRTIQKLFDIPKNIIIKMKKET